MRFDYSRLNSKEKQTRWEKKPECLQSWIKIHWNYDIYSNRFMNFKKITFFSIAYIFLLFALRLVYPLIFSYYNKWYLIGTNERTSERGNATKNGHICYTTSKHTIRIGRRKRHTIAMKSQVCIRQNK